MVRTVQQSVVEANVVGAAHYTGRCKVNGAYLPRVIDVRARVRARAAAPVSFLAEAPFEPCGSRGACRIDSARVDDYASWANFAWNTFFAF
jgi:hypothetical protein